MWVGSLLAEGAWQWPYGYAFLIESGYIAAHVEQVYALDFDDPDDRQFVRLQHHRALLTLVWELTA